MHPSVHDSVMNQYTMYKRYKGSAKLLLVSFFSLSEYLDVLEKICRLLHGSSGGNAKSSSTHVLIYLAAAVSDFQVPTESLSTHKIQSAKTTDDGDDQTVSIKLTPVQKVLRQLVVHWIPDAFVVSFKANTVHVRTRAYTCAHIICTDIHTPSARVCMDPARDCATLRRGYSFL